MPCRDDRDDCRQDYSDLQTKLDKVTRLLCGVCRATEKAGGGKLIAANKELNTWWKQHQEADRRREAAEQAERDQQAKRQAALDKLSPEERKLLNIRIS